VSTFKVPKIRIDVWLDVEEYNAVGNYARDNGLKNYSQGLQNIVREWRRFKKVVANLETEIRDKAVQNAKIIQEK